MFKKLLSLVLVLCALAAPLALGEESAAMRVVDLAGCGDALAVMGYDVVGTTLCRSDDYTALPAYLEEPLSGATVLGSAAQTEFDLDAIRALEPDLIIISPVQADLSKSLKKIANTVSVKLKMRSWKADMLTLGEKLGKRDEAAAWLDDYSDKATAQGKAIKKWLDGKTRTLALMISSGQFYAFVDGGLGSVLYNDLGLKRPKGMSDRMGIAMTTVSIEQLAALEIDNLILIGDEADRRGLDYNAEWLKLSVVGKKRVVELPVEPYLGMGYGCLGSEKLLSELETILATLG